MNSSQLQKLPIGISDFQEIIKGQYFYVDKSILIQEVLSEAAKVLLFPRPRRFGKTLNLNMLKNFFEKTNEDHASLFEGLAISQQPECMEKQGNYPVIYLTFKSTKNDSWEMCYASLTKAIAREFKRHQSILPKLDTFQKQEFNQIASRNAPVVDFQEALQTLTEMLHDVYGQPVVILIDEYDVPIQSAYVNGFYDEAASFIRNFLTAGLKDNSLLYKAVLTGILRVARESIFSGLNNIEVYSILSDRMANQFGLTEAEVSQTLKQFDLEDNEKEVEQWYNGYGFGNQKIYNPWSIIHFLDKQKVAPYWINTSDNQMIRDLVAGGDTQIQVDHAALIQGETITTTLNEHIVYSDIEKDRESVWNFLAFSGYLSVEKKYEIERKQFYELKIPNLEVMTFFEESLIKWFQQFKVGLNIDRMLKALIEGEVTLFGQELQAIVEAVMSFHDIGTKEPEKTYHIFVLGLLVRLGGFYQIDSNRESGQGRYDIMLIPRNPTQKGIILEFKQVGKKSQTKTALKKAIKQIQENDYVQRLRSQGFQKNFGIALVFFGKKVWLDHCSL